LREALHDAECAAMVMETKLGEARPVERDQVGYREQAMVRQGDEWQGFRHPVLTVRRPWFSLLGRTMHVHAPDGSLVAFVKKPIFKLKDEFTIYADESEQRPLLHIKARAIIGINLCYDVTDCATQQRVGTIRRLGMASIFRDTYELLDAREQPVGDFEETGHSVLRRFIPLLLGEWQIAVQGARVGRVEQVWRWFSYEFTLDLSMNEQRIDPRFAVALTVFALLREAAREQR
jgi:hypothetical protein